MNLSGSRSRSPPPSTPGPPPPRAREGRALKLGLSVSIGIHLVALLLYPLLLERVDPLSPPDIEDPERPVEGIEVVQVVEPPEPEPLPPVDPPLSPDEPEDQAEEAAEPDEPAPPPEEDPEPAPEMVDVGPPEEEEEDAAGPSVAERLQPRMIDPRLWAPVESRHTDLTDHERAELLLRGMIQSWSDSVAVAEALSDRARDWTYTDDEGRRWGLSPGRLHLGDFSIPLPFAFEVPPGRRDELSERQWMINELERGSQNAIIRDTWADRARAIRDRMEEERAPSPEASDGGG